jgi:hypothetical protein
MKYNIRTIFYLISSLSITVGRRLSCCTCTCKPLSLSVNSSSIAQLPSDYTTSSISSTSSTSATSSTPTSSRISGTSSTSTASGTSENSGWLTITSLITSEGTTYTQRYTQAFQVVNGYTTLRSGVFFIPGSSFVLPTPTPVTSLLIITITDYYTPTIKSTALTTTKH